MLSGCAKPIPPETLKNLYEVESKARSMKPQSEVALLYVISVNTPQKGLYTTLLINNEPVMSGSLHEKFNVFCLPPASYNLNFPGQTPFMPDQHELLTAKVGEIYVRAYDQFTGVFFIVPVHTSNLSIVSLDAAKEEMAIKTIGQDKIYQVSRYRCRQLNE